MSYFNFFTFSFCLFFFVLVFSPKKLHAQQSTRWLLAELTTAQGIRKVEILTTLSQQVEDHAKAQSYANEALSVSQSMDYKDGIAVSYICLGNLARYVLHKVTASDSLQSLVNQYNTNKESIIKINILLSETVFVGQILKIENEKGLQEAENFYNKALETRALQGNKDGEVWALKKLGNLQEDFKNWEKAEKYYLDWLKARESEGDTAKIAWAYTNLAEFYAKNEAVQPDYTDKLENVLNQRFKLKAGNLSIPQQVTELGQIAKFYDRYGNTIKAEIYFKKAIAIVPDKSIWRSYPKLFAYFSHIFPEEKRFFYPELLNYYLEKGKRNYEKSKFEEAEAYFEKYLQTCKEVFGKIDAGDYATISTYYKSQKNYIANIGYLCKVLEYRLKYEDASTIKWTKIGLEDGHNALFYPEENYTLGKRYYRVSKNSESLISLFNNWQKADKIKMLNPQIRDSYEVLERGTQLLVGFDTTWLPKPAPLHYQNTIQSIESVLPIVKDKEIQITLAKILAVLYEAAGNDEKAIIYLEKLATYFKQVVIKERITQKNDYKFHTMIRGETVYGVSKKYNIPLNNIVKWNGERNTNTNIEVGSKLILDAITYQRIKSIQKAQPKKSIKEIISEVSPNTNEKLINIQSNISIFKKIGSLYEKQGNYAKATAIYQNLANDAEKEKDWEQTADAWNLAGQVYQKQQHWKAMLAQYEKIITFLESKKITVDDYYHVQLAIAHKSLGNKEIAVKYAKLALYEKKTEKKLEVYSSNNQGNEEYGTVNPAISNNKIPVSAFTDTFFAIKEKYGLNDEQIASWNNLNINMVRTGYIPIEMTELIINLDNDPHRKVIELTEEKLINRQNLSAYISNKAHEILKELLTFDTVKDSIYIVHTIGEGESIESIKQMYGISENCLSQWNYFENKELIKGMKIKICKKEDWAKNVYKDGKIVDNEPIYYTASNDYGEHPHNIALKYGMTEEQLKSINQNRLSNYISRGTKVIVGFKIGSNFCKCE